MCIRKEVISKNNPDKISIRSATPRDSADAAELIFMTGEGIFKYLFYPEKDKTVTLLGRLFEMKANDFTHECARIAEMDSLTAGLVLFVDRAAMKKNFIGSGIALVKAMGLFPALKRSRRCIRFERLFPDPDKETLYINHLAIFEEFRARGVAHELLALCEQEAKTRSLSKLALDVKVDNTAAILVYEKYGFKNVQKIESKKFKAEFGFKGAYRMVKSL